MTDNYEEVKRHNETIQRFEKFLGILRNELHWAAFRFNTGSDQQCYVQKQHCFVDGIHNPNAANVTVTLKEDGVVIYQETIAPGATSANLRIPFMRECVLVTDGAAVTIWGRIRS